MRASKGDETSDRWGVASLRVRSKEHTALRETNGVDCWCRREDWMSGYILADGLDLFCCVSQEGTGSVIGWVFRYSDWVDKCAWVDGLDELNDLVDAIRGVIVSQAVPE